MLDEVAAATDALRSRVVELQQHVKQSVQARSWEAFWLVAVEGYSTRAVAEALGMTYAAVYVGCQRVREILRKEAERMNLKQPEQRGELP